jgi:hypothetical protein
MGTKTGLNSDSVYYDRDTGTYNRVGGPAPTALDLLRNAGIPYPDYAAEAVADAQAADAYASSLEENVPSNVTFTVDDYLKGIDASDGLSQDETKLAFDLLSDGTVTVADLAAKTGIPASAIQSTYDTIAAANAAQAQADLAAEIAAADAEERRVTGMLNEFGETYAEEQARLALERSAANDVIMKSNTLAAESAARQAAQAEEAAQAAAASPEAADTQAKDDDFDTKVNAAGGVTPGTIGEVIEIALEVYGDDSRGVVKVISESLKGGLTMKDLEEATDLSGDEILEAAKTAANDPDKSLTPGEILSGAANTVYDITNKVVDIVEKGLEVTGIEKVIDTIGNTVSKIVGLDPNQTQKVLVVNPTTGQITVQASNIPGGGILSTLPQSPYVPIGTTSGGTTYGIDAENAIINVVLGKILTNGGLDQGDTKTIIGAAVEETLGIPMEAAVGVIDSAEDLIKSTVKTVKDSGVLAGSGNRQDDEEAAAAAETTGFEVITGGEGEDTLTGGTGDTTLTGGTGNDTITGSTSATDGLMGPFQVDDDGNIILPSSSTSNTTLTLAPTVTANTPCETTGEVRDPVTLVCAKPTGTTTGTTTGTITASTPCETTGEVRDPVTLVCAKPTGTTTGTTTGTITASTPCETTGEVRDPVTLVCAKPTGTTTGGGGTTITCPDTYNNAGDVVADISLCGGLKSTSTVVDEDDDKTVVVDGVTNVVNYVCKEEGAVYNPVTEKCEKTNTTTLDTTVKEEVVCSDPDAVYDATLNNGQGGCFKINKTSLATSDTREEVVCSDPDAVYDATLNNGQGGCFKINKTSLATSDTREEVVCSDPDAVYDATLNNGQGGCFKTTTRTIEGANTLTQTICETGKWDETLQKCVNTVTGDVINKTICEDGSQPDANGNCITKVTGNAITQTICETGKWDETLQKCVNTVTGDVINKTICEDGSEPDANGNCITQVTGNAITQTVCETGKWDETLQKCVNTITGDVINKTVCDDGSKPDADGNCITTTTIDTTENKVCSDGQPPDPETGCARTIYMDTTTNTICPEESYKGEDGRCYNDVTGEVVQNNICPAGTTYNETSKQCEYSKYFCGPGFTFNILTSQCEPDDKKEEETGGITTLPTFDLKVPGRGDFVTADDVLVENTGDVGGIYSILPAPVRESFLAGRRQQDIRNVADTVGIQQGAELEQDQAAVDRFAGYANAFDVGTPELLDISGVLPGDLPAYEEKFNVQFPEFGIAPPVRPDEDLFPIAGARFDPTTYTPTAMAAGGVVEKENGIESLMDRRQQAVNRMLIKRAGSYFGR